MILEEDGIILSSFRFKESSFIIKCFLKHSGVVSGYFKPSNKYMLEPEVGSIAKVVWKARLNDQLGYITYETIHNTRAHFYDKPEIELAVITMLRFINMVLLEHDPHTKLFEEVEKLLYEMPNADNPITLYSKFELSSLLDAIGYGLDLSQCVATKTRDRLDFISPKSGCAVSYDAGVQYQDKMFAMPEFKDFDDEVSILHSLNVSGYFINKYFLKPFNQNFPFSRELLIAKLQKKILMLSNE